MVNDTMIIPSESEQEKLRREMLDSCQEVLAEMVHTKDGSRVVREFLAWGTAKVRVSHMSVLTLPLLYFVFIGSETNFENPQTTY